MKKTQQIVRQRVMNKKQEKSSAESGMYKKIIKIKIGGRNIEVDVGALARIIAINQADWKAYIGKAERVARALPEILKCAHIEADLFNKP